LIVYKMKKKRIIRISLLISFMLISTFGYFNNKEKRNILTQFNIKKYEHYNACVYNNDSSYDSLQLYCHGLKEFLILNSIDGSGEITSELPPYIEAESFEEVKKDLIKPIEEIQAKLIEEERNSSYWFWIPLFAMHLIAFLNIKQSNKENKTPPNNMQ